MKFKEKYTLMLNYMSDVMAILKQIYHMVFVKHHYYCGWQMLIMLPALVKFRRSPAKQEYISPFVYVMQ